MHGVEVPGKVRTFIVGIVRDKNAVAKYCAAEFRNLDADLGVAEIFYFFEFNALLLLK